VKNICIYTSNEKLESNSPAESEKEGRSNNSTGIIVADYFCDRRHGNVIRDREGARKRASTYPKKALILMWAALLADSLVSVTRHFRRLYF